MLLISLFACTQTETPTDNATEPTPAEDEIVEFGPATGSFSAETASTEALVALGSTMADMMEDEGVRRFFEDGGDHLVAPPPSEERCVTASFDSGDIVLDYDACEDAAGQLTLSWEGEGTVTGTWSEDFQVGDQALSGTLAIQLYDGALSAWSVDGIVASGPNGALEADFDWSLAVDSTGLTIDGSWSSEVVQTDGAPYANELDIVGLTWSFTDPCRCPTAGDISQVLVATLETVTIDWDDFINLGDGSDDFEPQEIDIEDVDVTVESLVSFSSCSATVTVDADDVEIVLPKEETGLPIDLTVTLPASATADALEAVLQAALDGMC